MSSGRWCYFEKNSRKVTFTSIPSILFSQTDFFVLLRANESSESSSGSLLLPPFLGEAVA